ncbi:MAG: large-conductance mechanosensitive channel protein MscL [Gammaproteobacteria bacterium]|nr:large-conductance mechanosensitive channel protein MscL [Gammaproteobacteria bacterium]
MSLLQEFRTFAMKGNVVDMAVGVVIGAAFGKIVSSLVGDIITPPIGLLIGGVDFRDLAIHLSSPLANTPVTINYGKFIQSMFDFIVIAFAIFMALKVINRLRAKHEAVPVMTKEQQLLTEIRDLLRERG